MTRREQQKTDEHSLKEEVDGDQSGQGRGRGRGRGKAKAKAKAKAKGRPAPKAKTTEKSQTKKGKDSKAEVKIVKDKGDENGAKKRKTAPKETKTADKDKIGKKPSKKADGADKIDEKKDKPQKKKKKKTADEETKPQSRTWAGRWIPSEPAALDRFDAIRSVFMDYIAPKVKAPSSLQNAYFTLCNTAFASLSPNAEKKEFVACAKLQVEKFLATEKVRI